MGIFDPIPFKQPPAVSLEGPGAKFSKKRGELSPQPPMRQVMVVPFPVGIDTEAGNPNRFLGPQ